MKLRFSTGELPASVIALISEDEGKDAQEVARRPETVALTVEGSNGEPSGYAVFGQDDGDMVAIYYARSFVVGVGPIVMKQLFGASQVLGVPLRVHVQSIRDISRKARMFGAEVSEEGVDADGILQGVFA